MSITYFSILIY